MRERSGLFRNGISVGGAVVVTVSAVLFLVFLVIELLGYHGNPYTGMVFFLVLPGLFVAGLIIIPLGALRERRRRAAGLGPWRWPAFDFAVPRQRRVAWAVLVLTVVNVMIVGVATYKGIEYMDSPRFCGQVCHTVMEPEWAGYQESSHSRVACVQCHIGPGAPWFVKAKLSGLRQVYAVTFNTHARPIPSPVVDLRPARDTCEQCHWPEKFHGDKVVTRREYADDETNTESVTSLRMHIGGVAAAGGGASGIHWHVSQQNRIEYVASDSKRQTIPWIKLTDGAGRETVYRSDGVAGVAPPAGERRTLDCVDCHNRPAHTFAVSVERAVDEAIAAGAVDRGLPFVRREMVRLLRGQYASRAEASTQFLHELQAFYAGKGVAAGTVAAVAAETTRLYGRNVFPAMGVTWGTYPNNIGHAVFPGCFRCHDDQHVAASGQTVAQDCSLCHTIEG